MSNDNKLLFGVGAPQVHTRLPVELEEIRRCIERAEDLGFHSLWVQEQAGLRATAGALEGVSMLSYAAALTRRIRLGNAVFLINLRNPIQLAKSLASLDQLSRGRLIAGVGLGGVTRLYGAYGLSPEHRVARFVESLTLIKKLWTEEDFTFEGKFWQLKKASLWPKPFQKPHPPIWFGANSPAALQRAVRLGAGFLGAGSSSTADFRTQAQIVRQALAEAKKEPADFMIGKRVYLAVDKDRERAARRLKEWFGLYYGQADLAERVAVWGSAEECVERLREIVAAGARLLLLNPVFDMMEQMEVLASEVVPKVTSS
ncbi:MAG: LLM class flavin-dependent oxidoreductase [Deltaproteobacteria bacterium]|nr:LLM class flavin-dependent oxidoreductase [Deltaproteobacteria bacterium]